MRLKSKIREKKQKPKPTSTDLKIMEWRYNQF